MLQILLIGFFIGLIVLDIIVVIRLGFPLLGIYTRFSLLILIFSFFLSPYLSRYIFEKISPNEDKKYRMLMIWVIVASILVSIWFSIFLIVNHHFFDFIAISIFTTSPLILIIILSSIWFWMNYRDDKLHHYNGYSFILALLISSSFAMLISSSPRGWLIPHVERGTVKVTEDGAFEYQMEVINNGTMNARARFLAIHLETGQETVIDIPNDQLQTIGGLLIFAGDPETSWEGLASWDGSLNLTPTIEPMVFNIDVFTQTGNGSDRWHIRHIFTIHLGTGEITLVEATSL